MSGFRLRLAGLHLLASMLVLSLVIGLFYLAWYAWPGWYLLGAQTVVGILVLVDVGLGPLATLVVSNPTKPHLELRRDIALIVLIQMVALGYGIHTLWTGRPLYYAFSVDRIQIVPAAVFDEQKLEQARRAKATILPSWDSLPQWIWVPLPDDPAESVKIIVGSVFGGEDIVFQPQYFRRFEEGIPTLRQQLLPLRLLLDGHILNEADYHALLDQIGRPESELGMLPVEGRAKDGVWIFDRINGKPLLFKRAVVWEAARKYRMHND